MSLIRFIILFPSSRTIIWDTPPAKPNISHAFSDSTSRPRNIELKTLSRSPWETIMMFTESSAITWSKKGFSLFHSSRRLSASEKRRSSIVFSSHSRFSRNHCTDFPQHRPTVSVSLLHVRRSVWQGRHHRRSRHFRNTRAWRP